MGKKKLTCVAMVIFLVVLGPCGTASAEGGTTIEGVIGIRMKDDQMAHGDWIRVLLVRDPVRIPELPDTLASQPYQQTDAILINAHMTFYKRIMEKTTDPDFITASTLTRPDGTFKFSNIAPGSYYVIVTFPSMIRGYKVAWQVPVRTFKGKVAQVELTNDNFALPTYCRN